MSYPVTRRTVLKSAAALCASGLILPPSVFGAEGRLLVAETRTIEVLGRAATVFGLTGVDGTHGLRFNEGERFDVTLQNRTTEATSIHWHGQVPEPEADGITETGYVGPIGAGDSRRYDFAARPGTHWMHSHHGLQEQDLLAAPLIVRDAEAVRADVQEVVVLLHDFSFRSPEEILEGLTGSSTMDHGASHGAPAPMDHSMMARGGMDLNDVEFDAYLANDRTLEDPLVVRAERSGRVRLRVSTAAPRPPSGWNWANTRRPSSRSTAIRSSRLPVAVSRWLRRSASTCWSMCLPVQSSPCSPSGRVTGPEPASSWRRPE